MTREPIRHITSGTGPGTLLEITPEAVGWNYVSSVGSYISGFGALIFLYGLFDAFYLRKERAANNPWGPGATTLEWTLSSPPPFHQFNTLPRIK